MRTGERKRTTWLWPLLLAVVCLALPVLTGSAAAEDKEFKAMNVTTATGTVIPVAEGDASLDVFVGNQITLVPDITKESGYTYTYTWTVNGVKQDWTGTTILRTPQAAGAITYVCTATTVNDTTELAGTTFVAQATINAVAPSIRGSTTLKPGAKANEYKVAFGGTPQPGVDSNRYTYAWTLNPTKGTLDDFLKACVLTSGDSGTMSLRVKAHANAYMLNGGALGCTVTVNGQTKEAWLGNLNVAILVLPKSTADTKTVNADVITDPKTATATFGLSGVYGGNDVSKDLTYTWQKRENGNQWDDIQTDEGTKDVFQMYVDSASWGGDTEYRCIVSDRPMNGINDTTANSTTSGIFQVVRVDHPLIICPRVHVDPDRVVVVEGAPKALTATGRIILPANRNGASADSTVYTATVMIGDKDAKNWTPVADGQRSVIGALEKCDPISADFTPAIGIFPYKLVVSSDAGEGALDESDPFWITAADKNISVTARSFPAPNGDGRILVDPDQAITYTIDAKGGTGKWGYIWFPEDGDFNGGCFPYEDENAYVDPNPLQGSTMHALVFPLDHCGHVIWLNDGGRGAEGVGINGVTASNYRNFLNYWVDSFGMAWVDLQWVRTPKDAVVPWSLLKDDGSREVGYLQAMGGKGDSGYYYSVDSDDWREVSVPRLRNGQMDSGMPFIVTTDIFKDHDFGDGKTARFSIRFKAEDEGGQYVISDPMTLTVLQDAALTIGGAVWSGDAYEAEYREGHPVTLTANLEGDTADSYRWTLGGFDPATGASWTAPSDLKASDQPYEVTVDALSGTKTLATTTVRLTVLAAPVLTVDAKFVPQSVIAKETATMEIRALTGSGSYIFEAGNRSDDLDTLTPEADGTSAKWAFTAPNIDGTFPYCWQVTDQATGEVKSGDCSLTVTSGDSGDTVAFSIRTPSSASRAVGSRLQMVLTNSGTKWITASDLNWTSNPTSIATVGADGWVDILAAGEVTITATLKDDASNKADYTFTAGQTTYTVIPPEGLTGIKAGQAVDLWFTTDPKDGKFSATGTLPGSLILSEDGHLTGTAPEKGTYTLPDLTVTWPDGYSKTASDIQITVTDGGSHSDSGGGCNGGFGILALALSAFWAFKRQGS